MYNCFVTPRQYNPKKSILQRYNSLDTVVFEQAKYHSFLGGDDADKVAKLLNLDKSLKLPQGFWILSSNKRKAALRLGVEALPEPTQEEIDSITPKKEVGDD